MSTRYAREGSELQQERWASSPEYSNYINAGLAAKRIEQLADPRLRELLWFVQSHSLTPRGLDRLCDALMAHFPERVGSPTMIRIGCEPDVAYPAAVVRQVRDEIPTGDFPLRGDVYEDGSWLWSGDEPTNARVDEESPESYKGEAFYQEVRKAALSLPDHLTRLCLDPAIDLDGSATHVIGERVTGVWYFSGLIDGLLRYRQHCIDHAFDKLADTETKERICDALEFCYSERRMVQITGPAGTGKSAALKAWCNTHPGLARYVEVPSSSDDRSFYVAVASALGVANGQSYSGNQIKNRMEEALKTSGVMLVLDESQFLWPQYARPRGVPSRIQWLKTAFDAGVPIAIVALPNFSVWQRLYVEKTLWQDEQLERRINRKISLPEALSSSELTKIAKALHPHGTANEWKLLTGCAIASPKKQASAITEALISARYMAKANGRDEPTFEEIDAAVQMNFTPVASSVPPPPKDDADDAAQNGASGVVAPAAQSPCSRDAGASKKSAEHAKRNRQKVPRDRAFNHRRSPRPAVEEAAPLT
jgi:hypothetical protein